MKPSQAVELLGTLKEKSLTLEDLYERMRATGSSWTLQQLQLFLMCASGVRRDPTVGTFHVASRGVDEELQDAILQAVRSFAGKHVSASQVRVRLPNDYVTTDEQILALARRTPGLEVFGPKLIRIAQ